MSHVLSVPCANIRSVLSKSDILYNYNFFIDGKQTDLVFLTETWLDTDTADF